MSGFSFARLQSEHADWAERNFGSAGDPGFHRRGSVLGVAEEIGELAEELDSPAHIVELTRALGRLAHATLKSTQQIRMNEDHAARAQDAVADIVVFLSDVCTRNGWNFEQVVEQTWDQVKQRDWRKKDAA